LGVLEWARQAEARGAGEILLTSMDSDGTRNGFDCELTAAVSAAVHIPVIASGGAGNVGHFADVFTRGFADAALAASIFHFGISDARTMKKELAAFGLPMRLPC
jgi:cyclase